MAKLYRSAWNKCLNQAEPQLKALRTKQDLSDHPSNQLGFCQNLVWIRLNPKSFESSKKPHTTPVSQANSMQVPFCLNLVWAHFNFHFESNTLKLSFQMISGKIPNWNSGVFARHNFLPKSRLPWGWSVAGLVQAGLGVAVLAGADAECCPFPPHFLAHIWAIWQAFALFKHKLGQKVLHLGGWDGVFAQLVGKATQVLFSLVQPAFIEKSLFQWNLCLCFCVSYK